MADGERYEIVITRSAILRYQDEILPYLQRNFTPQRVFEIDSSLMGQVFSLESNPNRGSVEKYLRKDSRVFRYILFRETKLFELKIVFFIQDQSNKVFVTDFFPTKMNPTRIKS